MLLVGFFISQGVFDVGERIEEDYIDGAVVGLEVVFNVQRIPQRVHHVSMKMLQSSQRVFFGVQNLLRALFALLQVGCFFGPKHDV